MFDHIATGIVRQIQRLTEERDAFRQDAVRYRRLRDRTATRLRVWLPHEHDAGATGPFDLQHLDAALDAE